MRDRSNQTVVSSQKSNTVDTTLFDNRGWVKAG